MQRCYRFGGMMGALCALGLFAGCSGNGRVGGNASLLSGVQGQAFRGPITPAVQQGITDEAPLPNVVIVVQRQDGSEVARQTTDVAGHYKIGAAPGTYQVAGLAPNGSGSFPSPPASQTVTIPVAQYVTVNISYDTGIR